MVPKLDKNLDSGDACGCGNASCWNDMAAKSGNSPFSRFSCDRSTYAEVPA